VVASLIQQLRISESFDRHKAVLHARLRNTEKTSYGFEFLALSGRPRTSSEPSLSIFCWSDLATKQKACGASSRMRSEGDQRVTNAEHGDLVGENRVFAPTAYSPHALAKMAR
jgi:hypothetical protein